MQHAQALAIKGNEARSKILSNVDPSDFAWSIPIMRTGYAGRGLVYIVIAVMSLIAIWQGGQAQGTQSALASLQGGWGTLIVGLIAVGMFAYAIWRFVDSLWDLEAYGTSAKGLIARIGMVVTGLAHAGIGVLAITILGVTSGSSGSSSASFVARILEMDGGRWILGVAGALTVAAGIYYLQKAFSRSFLDHLRSNRFTRNWSWVLSAGVAAQGVVVGIIGGLIVYAGLTADASEVGGLGTVFDWLREQPYGFVLVVALCLGLAGFALFCFVNAAYRIIPKAADADTMSVAAYRKQNA